jgi:beta-glucanase (GH16 family)
MLSPSIALRGAIFSVAIDWLLLAAACASASEMTAPDEYKLVWADEFDRAGTPDPQNWTFERGFVRNEELQWYQSDNVRCDGGRLIIEARRESVKNPKYNPESRRWNLRRPESEYTSASMMTRGRHQWLYGRFVMRGKIDTRPGLWPAFWTLGSARGWPGCGEIDVMESYGGKLLANAAWRGGGGRPAWDSVALPLASFGSDDRSKSNWSDTFHEWRMDWDHEWIKLYVDDKLINKVDVAAAINHDSQHSHPFREPHYLILNLAVGGTQGGDPSATEFPARFEVDYVRVYQQSATASESR